MSIEHRSIEEQFSQWKTRPAVATIQRKYSAAKIEKKSEKRFERDERQRLTIVQKYQDEADEWFRTIDEKAKVHLRDFVKAYLAARVGVSVGDTFEDMCRHGNDRECAANISRTTYSGYNQVIEIVKAARAITCCSANVKCVALDKIIERDGYDVRQDRLDRQDRNGLMQDGDIKLLQELKVNGGVNTNLLVSAFLWGSSMEILPRRNISKDFDSDLMWHDLIKRANGERTIQGYFMMRAFQYVDVSSKEYKELVQVFRADERLYKFQEAARLKLTDRRKFQMVAQYDYFAKSLKDDDSSGLDFFLGQKLGLIKDFD